ncbi:hypothetical protein CONPUDRAFT_162707 [Coniophora puteana RWD-64-598 SS2]|uniref:DUF6532 domain-containing protein n=1 Tax=Coniophora puteana (strain RWD-64-598) TaxID=741705 RepID=A0A5M3N3U8_CONPW|nr:uncharacterized protein CONPUDRAFT_162707 [Coniophora puteana RWD-64-598 SS2]EIW85525.1 hypothetical protein CONPUDRAFT_162707 [Coniophora puteana RWD-64-598 SS2]
MHSTPPPVTGAFDDDEGAAALAAARAQKSLKQKRSQPRSVEAAVTAVPIAAATTSKMGVTSTGKRTTAQMGLVISHKDVDTAVEEHQGASKKKPKADIRKEDLPFFREPGFNDRWDAIKAELVGWAGTLSDPFSSNSHPDIWSVSQHAWDHAFRETEHVGYAVHRDEAIMKFIPATLDNWRSDIGKKAVKLIDDEMTKPSLSSSSSTRIAWVAERRKAQSPGEKRKPFLYADPSTFKGVFRGTLIMKVFAHHVQRVAKLYANDRLTDAPAGGLALSAAAVQRALFLWKDGYNAKGARTEDGGKVKGKHGFEGEWADQACKYTAKMDGMSSEKWDQVYAAVAPFVKGSSASSGAHAEQSDDDDSDGIVISSDEGI